MSDHLIGVVGLATGIPGLVEVCFHLGDFLVQRLGAYQMADEEISSMVLKLSTYWDIQKASLVKLTQISRSSTLVQEVEERLVQILERLRQLLHKAATLLAEYTSPNPTSSAALPGSSSDALKRLRYILFEEKQLAKLLEQISEWETLFKKRLILLADQESFKCPTSDSSETGSYRAVSSLRMPLMRPEATGTGESYELSSQEFPSYTLQQFEAQGQMIDSTSIFVSKTRPDIIVERYDTEIALRPRNEVVALASMLCSSQAEIMHILQCQGYYTQNVLRSNGSTETEINLVFKCPTPPKGPQDVCSLQKLLSGKPRISLNLRLKLAIDLATAIWYVHSGQMVHKSIRPEAVYFIRNRPSESLTVESHTTGQLYLGGFRRFRQKTAPRFLDHDLLQGRERVHEKSSKSVISGSTASTTFLEEQVPLETPGFSTRLLYRHPDRWGMRVNKPFTMLHDVYSLGVIMLDIGRLTLLSDGSNSSNRRVQSTRAVLSRAVDALDCGDDIRLAAEAVHMKQALIGLAQHSLPLHMGMKYTEVVISCLTGLEGNLGSADGCRVGPVGPAYIDKVLEKLEQIHV